MEVVDIPGAMDNMGWRVAPQLMRRWLLSTSNTMTVERRRGDHDPMTFRKEEYDDQIVKMRWVLNNFPRTHLAY